MTKSLSSNHTYYYSYDWLTMPDKSGTLVCATCGKKRKYLPFFEDDTKCIKVLDKPKSPVVSGNLKP